MSFIVLSACNSTTQSDVDKNLTLGLVQQEISVGTSSVHVLETLGSPNIVKSQHPDNSEVWIYDKIYQSNSSTNIGVGAAGGGSDIIGLVSAGNRSSETSSKSLTVIIKFNEDENVSDVSYLRTAF